MNTSINEANSTPEPGAEKIVKMPGGESMVFCWCPPGVFMMGGEKGGGVGLICTYSQPVHEVTIEEGFWIGKYPVTQRQWVSIMQYNQSAFKNYSDYSDDCPADMVAYTAVVKFCDKISSVLGEGVAHLPSEAQWEYACRAGMKEWDESVAVASAWVWKGSNNRIHPVGQKEPNAWGIHDMLGNVWEYCADWPHANYEGAPSDGSAWVGSTPDRGHRMCRGGSWGQSLNSWVDRKDILCPNSQTGFRIVLSNGLRYTIDQQQKNEANSTPEPGAEKIVVAGSFSGENSPSEGFEICVGKLNKENLKEIINLLKEDEYLDSDYMESFYDRDDVYHSNGLLIPKKKVQKLFRRASKDDDIRIPDPMSLSAGNWTLTKPIFNEIKLEKSQLYLISCRREEIYFNAKLTAEYPVDEKVEVSLMFDCLPFLSSYAGTACLLNEATCKYGSFDRDPGDEEQGGDIGETEQFLMYLPVINEKNEAPENGLCTDIFNLDDIEEAGWPFCDGELCWTMSADDETIEGLTELYKKLR